MNVIATASPAAIEPIRDVQMLEVGTRYSVMIEDCCVVADFTSTFVGRTGDDHGIAVFENGVELYANRAGGWSALPAGKPGADPTPG